MKDKRLVVIFLTVFIDLVGFGIIIPLNPYLAEVFGASPFQVGILMSVYSLMQFLFAPVWGQLSDRYGRRPVILVSLFGAALAHGSFAFATSMTGLMLARGLAGMLGGNISAAMAYIADITPEEKRSQGMGLIGAAFGLGFICGPFIGGVFAEVGRHLGDYPPFGPSFPAIIASLICFLNFLSALRFLPESRVAGHPGADRGRRFAKIFKALTTPALGFLISIVFISTVAMAIIEASLFLYVQEIFGWSLTQASFGFAYIGVIMVITQGYLIRKWMPKVGERRTLQVGLILSALGFGLIPMNHSLLMSAIGVTLLGLGSGLANPSLNGSISLLSGKESQGNNLGVSQSLSSLARIIGPPVGGYFYQHLGASSPFMSSSTLVAVAVLGAIMMGAKIPTRGLMVQKA